MLFSIILRFGRVSRDRYRHFGRDRRDFQLAFGRGNRVVDRLRIVVQLVGELVLALANFLLASRHFIRRAFVLHKAVAANRYLVVRQRRAVVRLAVRSGGQRHLALADRQAAVIRHRNDIFLRLVYRANGILREVSVIGSGIRSLRANCDRAEISVFRRSGKAGNFLLFSIINLRVAVRFQRDVLMIVESDYVIGRVSLNLDLLGISRYRRVALDRNGGFRHLRPERLTVNGFGSRDLLGRVVPVVVHRVAQVGSLSINDRLSLIFGQRSFHNGLIRRITGDVRRRYRVLCAMV